MILVDNEPKGSFAAIMHIGGFCKPFAKVSNMTHPTFRVIWQHAGVSLQHFAHLFQADS